MFWALSVPMPLSLKTGPSVPHTPMPSDGSPGPSQKFQIAPPPPDSASNIIWVQNGAHINLIIVAPFPQPFICLSKVPENEPPPVTPTGSLMERVALFRSLLYHICLVPQKCSADRLERSVCTCLTQLYLVWDKKLTRCHVVLSFISTLQVAQHVSGNHVPIFRS